jgi:hypothetical protein
LDLKTLLALERPTRFYVWFPNEAAAAELRDYVYRWDVLDRTCGYSIVIEQALDAAAFDELWCALDYVTERNRGVVSGIYDVEQSRWIDGVNAA